ncbi:MAG: hypothetical protein CMP10_18985 [Zetaproteobacteria bacterium]|nr:hypothetical protein [Pseudobdellovibrionaceae bacterium]
MAAEEDSMFLECFLEEAIEILDNWEKHCLALEGGFNKEHCDALFRSAHNLKGSSRVVGLEELGGFIHVIEDVIMLLKDQKIDVTAPLIRLLLQSQTVMINWVIHLSDNPKYVPKELVDSIYHKLTLMRPSAADITDPKKNMMKPEIESEALEADASGSDSSGLVIFEDLKKNSDNKKSKAKKSKSKKVKAKKTSSGSKSKSKSKPKSKDLDSKIDSSVKKEIKTPKKDGPKDIGTILVEDGVVKEEDIDQAVSIQNRKIGQVLVAEGITSQKEVDQALVKQKKLKSSFDSTIRVSTNKLDDLLSLVGELSTQQAIISHCFSKGKQRTKTCLSAVDLASQRTIQLRNHSMSLRKQTVQRLFQRLQRSAKDLARDLDKNVQVVFEGAHIEIDKQIIEEIAQPLNHVVRNAIDHGIETRETRETFKKPELATLIIRAIDDNQGITIEVADDGGGLKLDVIKRIAIDKGIITKEDKKTDNEVAMLIFESGFSTAKVVTDLSGRGVGMDVVRTAIEGIGGKIDIDTKEGKGTTFSFNFQLPSILNIIDAVIINVEHNTYAVPITDLVEIIHLNDHEETEKKKNDKFFSHRGADIPVQKLKDYLQVAECQDNAISSYDPMGHNSKRPTLIAKYRNNLVAYEVDDIIGHQSIVIHNLKGAIGEMGCFAGGTILKNGEPGMIINLNLITRNVVNK